MINLDVADIVKSTYIMEKHNDSRERWIGKLAVPAGNKVADQNSTTPFQMTSGNDTWGDAVLICDTSDAPFYNTNTYFHIARVFLAATNNTKIWRVQGISSYTTPADGLAAGRYTDFMLVAPSPVVDSMPVEVRSPRLPAGIKVWFRAWALGENGKTIDLYYSIHEYEV